MKFAPRGTCESIQSPASRPAGSPPAPASTVRCSVDATRATLTASRLTQTSASTGRIRLPTSGRAASTATGATIGRRYWNPFTGHSSKNRTGTAIQHRSRRSGHEPRLRMITSPATAAASTSGPIISGTFDA